jgi:hypothetical protein
MVTDFLYLRIRINKDDPLFSSRALLDLFIGVSVTECEAFAWWSAYFF